MVMGQKNGACETTLNKQHHKIFKQIKARPRPQGHGHLWWGQGDDMAVMSGQVGGGGGGVGGGQGGVLGWWCNVCSAMLHIGAVWCIWCWIFNQRWLDKGWSVRRW